MWFVQHLPLKIWASIVVVLFVTFGLGVTSGNTTLIRELLGYQTLKESKPLPQEMKMRMDELSYNHNLRRKAILTSIFQEQDLAAKSRTNNPAIQQRITELQKDLEREDANYESELKTLALLGVSK